MRVLAFLREHDLEVLGHTMQLRRQLENYLRQVSDMRKCLRLVVPAKFVVAPPIPTWCVLVHIQCFRTPRRLYRKHVECLAAGGQTGYGSHLHFKIWDGRIHTHRHLHAPHHARRSYARLAGYPGIWTLRHQR